AGLVHYIGVGPPWDVVVPPGAQKTALPSDPSLGNVSRARARIELGTAPLVDLASPPGDLSLRRIAINLSDIPVDPSGTTFPGRSLTLIYGDGTGRPRLWLSQSASSNRPHVPGNPLPFGQKGSGVT